MRYRLYIETTGVTVLLTTGRTRFLVIIDAFSLAVHL